MTRRRKSPAAKRAERERPKRRRVVKRTWDRRPDPARRALLVERFLDYALEHGLAKATIREVGRELGTSGRMLLHYFGSRENLIVEALNALRVRSRDRVFKSLGSGPASFDEIYWKQWRFLTSRETLRYFHLSYQALGLALQSPKAYGAFLDSLTVDYRTSFEAVLEAQGFSAARSRAIATVYLSALRGLVIDLLVTGDRKRIRAAAALIAENLKRDLERPT